MPTAAPDDAEYIAAIRLTVSTVERLGGQRQAARYLGIPRTTVQSHLEIAKKLGIGAGDAGFEVAELPEELPPVEELIARRIKQFERKQAAHEARKLVDVRIREKGPIGIVHFGDPHVDDDGCNLPLLRRHIEIVKNTPGMFGANVGDLSNNWVGRLSRLYGEQGTTAREAWALVEWLVGSIPWLYLVKGNHDLWSGAGDPVDYMRKKVGVHQAWGVRLNLVFPNDKAVRANARHDFNGHSMWNPAHGPAKAAQMGWRDHLLVAGHKHTSALNVLKCPATGLISYAFRVAGYKVIDGYATQLGLPDQNISPAAVTVIDPSRADDDPELITFFWSVERGAEYLAYLRQRK